MELIKVKLPKAKGLIVAPIGDIQYSGPNGPTASDSLRRHIDRCLELGAYFVGTGDFIDFLSPSNRRRLIAADLYDTAQDVITERAMELNDAVFDLFLKDTVGRWLGMVEGHHFYEAGGQTTDQILANRLKTTFLGTSAFIRLDAFDVTIYVNHSTGAGKLPGAALNKGYHLAAGLEGADIYLFGHDTKLSTTRLSRPFPQWDKPPYVLKHHDIWIVNCGGFARSNIVGHRHGTIPRGDYAEAAMMVPSPLSAPLIHIQAADVHDRIRVAI